MKIIDTAVPGVLIFQPTMHADDRGFFMETFRSSHFATRGLGLDFVQDNQSRSKKARFAAFTFSGRDLRGSLYVFCLVKSLMWQWTSVRGHQRLVSGLASICRPITTGNCGSRPALLMDFM